MARLAPRGVMSRKLASKTPNVLVGSLVLKTTRLRNCQLPWRGNASKDDRGCALTLVRPDPTGIKWGAVCSSSAEAWCQGQDGPFRHASVIRARVLDRSFGFGPREHLKTELPKDRVGESHRTAAGVACRPESMRSVSSEDIRNEARRARRTREGKGR